jgi:hypothetical protein
MARLLSALRTMAGVRPRQIAHHLDPHRPAKAGTFVHDVFLSSTSQGFAAGGIKEVPSVFRSAPAFALGQRYNHTSKRADLLVGESRPMQDGT